MDKLENYVINHSTCGVPRCEYVENETDIDCNECQKIMLAEHDSKVRESSIDEFVKAIEKHQTRQDSYLEPPYIEMGLDMTDVLEVARELKEQKK